MQRTLELSVLFVSTCSAKFCENKFGGGFHGWDLPEGEYYPQYGNGISALFIVFIGLHMLVFFDNDSVFFRLMATTFAANGIGSFCFHYFGFWGAVDADTMTMVACMTTGYVVEEFWESYSDARKNRHSRHERVKRRIPMAFMWLIMITFSFWMVGGADLGGTSYYSALFEISFGVPMVVMTILVAIIIKQDWVRHEYMKPEVCKIAIFRFKIGLLSVCMCLPFYFYCERLCESSDFAKYFPGHLLWHIAMSWGLLNMLVFVTLLRSQNMKAYPVIYSRRLHGFYFVIFPGYHFADSEDAAVAAIRAESGLTFGQSNAALAPVQGEPSAVIGAYDKSGSETSI